MSVLHHDILLLSWSLRFARVVPLLGCELGSSFLRVNVLYLWLLAWDIVEVHLVHILLAVLAVWIERVVTVADVVLGRVSGLFKVLIDRHHLLLRPTLRVSANVHHIVAADSVLYILGWRRPNIPDHASAPGGLTLTISRRATIIVLHVLGINLLGVVFEKIHGRLRTLLRLEVDHVLRLLQVASVDALRRGHVLRVAHLARFVGRLSNLRSILLEHVVALI